MRLARGLTWVRTEGTPFSWVERQGRWLIVMDQLGRCLLFSVHATQPMSLYRGSYENMLDAFQFAQRLSREGT